MGKVVRVAWYNENWSSVVQYEDALSRSTYHLSGLLTVTGEVLPRDTASPHVAAINT